MLEPSTKACSAWRGKLAAAAKAFFFRRGFGPRRLAGAAIGRIADQGMAQMGQMHADLVGAPGFQPAFDQRGERPASRVRNVSITR